MRLGLICCSSATGLGIQGKGFYDNLKPDRTMVVDISALNGTTQHPDWYPDGMFIEGFPREYDIDTFMDGLDMVLITEAAYSYYVYEYGKHKGIKTVNQYNLEFFDWHNGTTPCPDAFIAPSKWGYSSIDKFCKDNNLPHTYLHYPVDRIKYRFRQITEAKIFIHNAGKPAAHDRNGTYSVIEASKYIKSDVKIKIHFQGEQGLAHQQTSTLQDYFDYAHDHGDLSKLILEATDPADNSELYQEGDVMIYPRRYGGNSLVLNEALSTGMPVIMTDISPNNEFLPQSWLVPTIYKSSFTPRIKVDIYEANVKALAEKIDEFASMTKPQMVIENTRANLLAEHISWDTMLPMYRDFFEQVVTMPQPSALQSVE